VVSTQSRTRYPEAIFFFFFFFSSWRHILCLFIHFTKEENENENEKEKKIIIDYKLS
jgi:hypothetical protein